MTCVGCGCEAIEGTPVFATVGVEAAAARNASASAASLSAVCKAGGDWVAVTDETIGVETPCIVASVVSGCGWCAMAFVDVGANVELFVRLIGVDTDTTAEGAAVVNVVVADAGANVGVVGTDICPELCTSFERPGRPCDNFCDFEGWEFKGEEEEEGEEEEVILIGGTVSDVVDEGKLGEEVGKVDIVDVLLLGVGYGDPLTDDDGVLLNDVLIANDGVGGVGVMKPFDEEVGCTTLT